MCLVAGPVPQPEPADYIRALLDGATRAGIERVVLLSTYGVDQAPPENLLDLPRRGASKASKSVA
jgi:hypothetical protein